MQTTLFLNFQVNSNKRIRQSMCVFISIQNSNCHETSVLSIAFRNNLQNKVLMEIKYFYINLEGIVAIKICILSNKHFFWKVGMCLLNHY